MLKAKVMSEDDYRSFLRPAVFDSMQQMLKFYGLESSAQVYYNGEIEIAKLVGSNSTDPIRTDTYTDGVYRNKLFIVAEFEQTDFNAGYGNQRRTPTERAFWMMDDEEPIILYPGFSGLKVNVSVVAGFNSEKLAQQFARRINMAQANQVSDMNFSATVHLGINPGILDFLESIHTLLVKNDPTTPALGDWFDKGCRHPVTTIMNAAGNNRRLVFPVRLDNIGIIFSDPVVQRARKADIFGKYEVECKYSFYFQEFTHWDLEYPLNIYQDEIDAIWIPQVQDKFKEQFNVKVAPESAFIQPFTENRQGQAPYYLKLPNHDPWTMQYREWIQPVVQARLSVADVDEQELFNLFELPGYEWDEDVKAFILNHRDLAFTPHDTPFPVMLYSNHLRIPAEQLRLDPDGSVWLLRAPTVKNTYRVVVGLDYAIRDYSDKLWGVLAANPNEQQLIPRIFNWFDWSSVPEPWINNLYPVLMGIDKGWGKPTLPFNRYMMDLGLQAYLLLRRK